MVSTFQLVLLIFENLTEKFFRLQLNTGGGYSKITTINLRLASWNLGSLQGNTTWSGQIFRNSTEIAGIIKFDIRHCPIIKINGVVQELQLLSKMHRFFFIFQKETCKLTEVPFAQHLKPGREFFLILCQFLLFIQVSFTKQI